MSKYKIGKDVGKLIVEVERLKAMVHECSCKQSECSEGATLPMPRGNDKPTEPNAENSHTFVLPKGKSCMITAWAHGELEQHLKIVGGDFTKDYTNNGDVPQADFIKATSVDRTFVIWAIYKNCYAGSNSCVNHGFNNALVNVIINTSSQLHIAWSVFPSNPSQRELEARLAIVDG